MLLKPPQAICSPLGTSKSNKMKQFILAILLLSLASCSGVAQKKVVNRSYTSNNKGDLKVAIVPYYSKGSQEVNEIFFQAFNKGRFIVSDPNKISHNILNHEGFNNSLRKTIYADFDVKKKPNLYSGLSEDEIIEFKASFLHSDILIVGSKINSRKVAKVNGSGSISSSGNIAVFDLRSGEFILQYPAKVKAHYNKISPNTSNPINELAESLYEGLENNLK